MLPAAMAGPGAPANAGEWVFVSDPRDVERLLTCDPAKVLTAPTNRFLEGVVGPRSILVLDEPEHMAERRLLLPHFHGERVAAYRELIEEITRDEIACWPRGEAIELWPRMQAITLRVIVRAVFGIVDPGRARRMEEQLRLMLDKLTSTRWQLGKGLRDLTGVGGRPGSAEAIALAPIDRMLAEEIAARRADLGLADRVDILSLLIGARYRDGGGLGDDALRDELITLLIAGHESTATELAWAFERLTRHPEMLGRLCEEAADGEDAYADAVVRETLRLRPVLPTVLRELTEPLELGGYELPAGTWVAPCAYLVHRRPDLYPDPLRFDPERFLGKTPGTYAWLPFGGGVRRCVGAAFAQLEIKQVLQTVCGEYELVPDRDRSEPIRPRFITHAPGRGARVRVGGKPSLASVA